MNMNWLSGVVDYGVLGLLLALSVLTVAVALERRAGSRRTRSGVSWPG
jgi:biopolymer transport protein ExbB